MKQGRMLALVAGTLALLAAAPLHAAPKQARPHPAGASATHQFTGVITALDHNSITVERGGRRAKTMVFARHADMKSSGDVEKNARVTVWYRDEGGTLTATRVVARTTKTAAR